MWKIKREIVKKNEVSKRVKEKTKGVKAGPLKKNNFFCGFPKGKIKMNVIIKTLLEPSQYKF